MSINIANLDLSPVHASTHDTTRAATDSHAFLEQLHNASRDIGNAGNVVQDAETQVRDAARQLVSVAFIQPILASLRDSPFKSEMFSGGQAEDSFGQQMDNTVAERLVGRLDETPQGFAIVNAVYEQMAKHMRQRSADPQAHSVNRVEAIDTHA